MSSTVTFQEKSKFKLTYKYSSLDREKTISTLNSLFQKFLNSNSSDPDFASSPQVLALSEEIFELLKSCFCNNAVDLSSENDAEDILLVSVAAADAAYVCIYKLVAENSTRDTKMESNFKIRALINVIADSLRRCTISSMSSTCFYLAASSACIAIKFGEMSSLLTMTQASTEIAHAAVIELINEIQRCTDSEYLDLEAVLNSVEHFVRQVLHPQYVYAIEVGNTLWQALLELLVVHHEKHFSFLQDILIESFSLHPEFTKLHCVNLKAPTMERHDRSVKVHQKDANFIQNLLLERIRMMMKIPIGREEYFFNILQIRLIAELEFSAFSTSYTLSSTTLLLDMQYICNRLKLQSFLNIIKHEEEASNLALIVLMIIYSNIETSFHHVIALLDWLNLWFNTQTSPQLQIMREIVSTLAHVCLTITLRKLSFKEEPSSNLVSCNTGNSSSQFPLKLLAMRLNASKTAALLSKYTCLSSIWKYKKGTPIDHLLVRGKIGVDLFLNRIDYFFLVTTLFHKSRRYRYQSIVGLQKFIETNLGLLFLPIFVKKISIESDSSLMWDILRLITSIPKDNPSSIPILSLLKYMQTCGSHAGQVVVVALAYMATKSPMLAVPALSNQVEQILTGWEILNREIEKGNKKMEESLEKEAEKLAAAMSGVYTLVQGRPARGTAFVPLIQKCIQYNKTAEVAACVAFRTLLTLCEEGILDSTKAFKVISKICPLSTKSFGDLNSKVRLSYIAFLRGVGDVSEKKKHLGTVFKILKFLKNLITLFVQENVTIEEEVFRAKLKPSEISEIFTTLAGFKPHVLLYFGNDLEFNENDVRCDENSQLIFTFTRSWIFCASKIINASSEEEKHQSLDNSVDSLGNVACWDWEKRDRSAYSSYKLEKATESILRFKEKPSGSKLFRKVVETLPDGFLKALLLSVTGIVSSDVEKITEAALALNCVQKSDIVPSGLPWNQITEEYFCSKRKMPMTLELQELVEKSLVEIAFTTESGAEHIVEKVLLKGSSSSNEYELNSLAMHQVCQCIVERSKERQLQSFIKYIATLDDKCRNSYMETYWNTCFSIQLNKDDRNTELKMLYHIPFEALGFDSLYNMGQNARIAMGKALSFLSIHEIEGYLPDMTGERSVTANIEMRTAIVNSDGWNGSVSALYGPMLRKSSMLRSCFPYVIDSLCANRLVCDWNKVSRFIKDELQNVSEQITGTDEREFDKIKHSVKFSAVFLYWAGFSRDILFTLDDKTWLEDFTALGLKFPNERVAITQIMKVWYRGDM